MNDELLETLLLNYIAVTSHRTFRNLDELFGLESSDLLAIIASMDDALLPVLVTLFKNSEKGTDIFTKLMGEHEEENRKLVDSFFNRYMTLVLPDESELFHEQNPLSFYLPRETLSDLTFVQSRQNFFMRQTITTINDYFEELFSEKTCFAADQQHEAWLYFWNKICQ
ncbi:MAG: hypothetical protein JW795_06440 [Chitinivibrionales bacterium]|nr:hypothetical protein [Chitinivibrionales bacterium]